MENGLFIGVKENKPSGDACLRTGANERKISVKLNTAVFILDPK